MKILCILLTVASLQISAKGFSQGITLSLKNASLETLFKEVEQQTSYTFVYSQEAMEQSKPITIVVQNQTLENVLRLCFLNQSLTYSFNEKFIVIKITEKEKETINVKGKVIDEKGDAVKGVTISIKNSKLITSTDNNGEFELNDIEPNSIVVITSIGYEKQELKLNGQTVLLVRLKILFNSLDESIVIAYGQTTRRFSTGSITKVTGEDLGKAPVSNPLAALQGRVPGLVVQATSGLPGASYNLQIRGQNSLKSDPNFATLPPIDQPLFIIDGVPFAPQNNNLNQLRSVTSPGYNSSFNNFYGGISPFNGINPGEIESIEVLRDADATAIYGSRGANGVILITTKKGDQGKTKFSLNVYTGENHVVHTMPMMNTQQYIEMRKEAINNDGDIPNLTIYSNGYAPDLLVYDTTKYTDWKKYFTGGSAHTTDVNASLGGGSATTQFHLGANYHRETYIFPGDFVYQKGTVNLSLHHSSFNKKLSIDISTDYSVDKNNSSGTPNLLSAFTLEPNYPNLIDPSGNLAWQYNGITLGGSYGINNMNPLAYLLKKYSITNNFLITHLQLSYNILKGLSLRSDFGYNYLNTHEYSGNPGSSQNPDFTRTASADFGSGNLNSWIIEPQAEYIKQIGRLKLTMLAGGTFQQDVNTSSLVSAWGYSNDALIESISGAPNKTASDAFSKYKYNAMFGRFNFILDKKYVVNLNGRRDGSSKFGPGKQFGNFGSVGAGWIFSDEKFIRKRLKFLTYGKLRASYGTSGNDNSIGNYQYISLWAPTNFSYQGSAGYLPQNLYNPEFSWSITKKLESAIDLGLFKNRILFTAIWYRNRSNNQLVFFQLPSQTGFAGVTENWSALVQNTGWEFEVSSTNIHNKSFSWTTTFNLSIPKNKLLSFPGLANSSYATRYVVGQSLSVLNKFRFAGVNDTTGLFEFYEAGGKITSSPKNISGTNFNDVQVIGNLDPKFFGGLNNSFSYKGIHLDILIEFRKQFGASYLAQIYNNHLPGFQYNEPTALLDRWQKTGDKTNIQKFSASYGDAYTAGVQYFSQSSGVYGDASYVRFKTVSLAYEFPEKIFSKIKAESFRIYANAQNLFTITNYKGDDPETQNFYGVPVLRTVAVGIQFTF